MVIEGISILLSHW